MMIGFRRTGTLICTSRSIPIEGRLRVQILDFLMILMAIFWQVANFMPVNLTITRFCEISQCEDSVNFSYAYYSRIQHPLSFFGDRFRWISFE